MRITLGVTDGAWAAYLRRREDLTEVNFWVPSGNNFTGRASVGEPFLFKTKSPENKLVGGGFFAGFYECRVSEAWAIFEQGNGVETEAELHNAIQRYRHRTGRQHHPDPTIGCVVLQNVFFADERDDMAQPEHWGRSIVQGKTYDDEDPDWGYVKHAFETLCARPRVDLHWEPDNIQVQLDPERYGAEHLTRSRLGQGSFRLAVLDAYDNRCAITGGRMSPTLQAAHIRPYAVGGAHAVPNGLALRSDMHTLFDRGYLGIDPDYRLRVSPRLETDFGNGVELYSREARGDVIRLPAREEERPDRSALDWHMQTVFLSA